MEKAHARGMFAPIEKKVFVVVHESVLASWLKDSFSVLTLAVLLYVNHEIGNGSAWVDAFATFLAFTFLMGKVGRSRGIVQDVYTREQLREWALRETA